MKVFDSPYFWDGYYGGAVNLCIMIVKYLIPHIEQNSTIKSLIII